MKPYYERGILLYHGDCRQVMAELPECSADAIVTDPPYGIHFMAKSWDQFGGPLGRDHQLGRERAGSMHAGEYDYTKNSAFQAWTEGWAIEALRVLKPGGHMLVCGSPRTYHRMTSGVEDAGFEIRDCLQWLFGSGFPKSLNLHGEWEGWGTALKPAYEPIVLARKPLVGTVAGNVAAYGVGGLNIDATRIDATDNKTFVRAAGERPRDQYRTGTTVGAAVPTERGRWPANVVLSHLEDCWSEYMDDCECMGGHSGKHTYTPYLNCVPECPVRMLDEQSGERKSGYAHVLRRGSTTGVGMGYGSSAKGNVMDATYGDSGGASRFFYTAKTSRAEREFGLDDLAPARRSDGRDKDIENPRLRTNARRNDHPTVKPVDLMRWLCRLVTPPGGTVLDPFLGSGSTGMAALDEGFRFVGIDLESHYLDIAQRRITRRHLIEPLPQRDAGQGGLAFSTEAPPPPPYEVTT